MSFMSRTPAPRTNPWGSADETPYTAAASPPAVTNPWETTPPSSATGAPSASSPAIPAPRAEPVPESAVQPTYAPPDAAPAGVPSVGAITTLPDGEGGSVPVPPPAMAPAGVLPESPNAPPPVRVPWAAPVIAPPTPIAAIDPPEASTPFIPLPRSPWEESPVLTPPPLATPPSPVPINEIPDPTMIAAPTGRSVGTPLPVDPSFSAPPLQVPGPADALPWQVTAPVIAAPAGAMPLGTPVPSDASPWNTFSPGPEEPLAPVPVEPSAPGAVESIADLGVPAQPIPAPAGATDLGGQNVPPATLPGSVDAPVSGPVTPPAGQNHWDLAPQTFSAEDNIINSEILPWEQTTYGSQPTIDPVASTRTQQLRAAEDAQLAKLNTGPDRFALAQQRYDDEVARTRSDYERDLKDATNQAAEHGYLRSGRLTNAYGDAEERRRIFKDTARSRFLTDALEGTIGDTRYNLGATSGIANSSSAEDAARREEQRIERQFGIGLTDKEIANGTRQRDEARTERAYQQTLAERALAQSIAQNQTEYDRQQDALRNAERLYGIGGQNDPASAYQQAAAGYGADAGASDAAIAELMRLLASRGGGA